MEVIHSDANSKIRDSLKRWNTVKSQSSPRPVTEYTEDLIRMSSSSELVNNVGQSVAPGANKIINATKTVGQEIKG
jgi:hypothetical protein